MVAKVRLGLFQILSLSPSLYRILSKQMVQSWLWSRLTCRLPGKGRLSCFHSESSFAAFRFFAGPNNAKGLEAWPACL